MKLFFLPGLVMGAAIAFAPVAQASPQADVDSYLAALTSANITGSRSNLLAIGAWVCQEVNENHFGRDQVAQGILNNPTNTITMDQARAMVDDAVKYLCLGMEPHPPVHVV